MKIEYLIGIIGLAGLIQIGIAWVAGIDKMKKDYPDYKGEEFLNWDRKHDDWDNKSHTENDFH